MIESHRKVEEVVPKCYNLVMKTIPLTKGYVTKVDDEDYEWLAVNRWYADKHWRDMVVRARRHTKTVDGKRHMISMSRIILKAPEGKYVDHINGDTLDNRKCNLRLCTNLQNSRNTQLSKRNTSGYKGVHLVKATGKWAVHIMVDGKLRHCGTFIDKVEAAKKYNNLAKKYFGDFAKLN